MSTKSKKRPTRTVRYVPAPAPLFALGGRYTLASGAQVTIKGMDWLGGKVGYIYFLTDKLPAYNLSVFSQHEFAGFGARLVKAA